MGTDDGNSLMVQKLIHFKEPQNGLGTKKRAHFFGFKAISCASRLEPFLLEAKKEKIF
jgi:hypothetical protein